MSALFKSEIFQYSCFLTNASVVEVNSTASSRAFGFITISSSRDQFTETNLLKKNAAFESSLSYTAIFFQNSSSVPKMPTSIYGPADTTLTSANKIFQLTVDDAQYLSAPQTPILLDSLLKKNFDTSLTYVQMRLSDGLIRGQVNPVNFLRRETIYPPELVYRSRQVEVFGLPRAVLHKDAKPKFATQRLIITPRKDTTTASLVLIYDVPIIKPEFNDVRSIWFHFNVKTDVVESLITVEWWNAVIGAWDLGGTVTSGNRLPLDKTAFVDGYDFINAPTAWNYLILDERRRDVKLKMRLSSPNSFQIDYAVIQVYVPRKYTNQEYRGFHDLD
jgi:hypothetical protein